MSRESSVWWRRLLCLLVVYRIPIYVGGVAVIGLLWVFDRAVGGVTGAVRTALVTVALAVMVFTYVGELVVGRAREESQTDESFERYSRKTKVAAAVAIGGLAVAAYLALTSNVLGALVFVAGSYLFARLGFSESETTANLENNGESDRGE
ncbi:hypothetical protein [Haladaptatus sp. NG-WS-4]